MSDWQGHSPEAEALLKVRWKPQKPRTNLDKPMILECGSWFASIFTSVTFGQVLLVVGLRFEIPYKPLILLSSAVPFSLVPQSRSKLLSSTLFYY